MMCCLKKEVRKGKGTNKVKKRKRRGKEKGSRVEKRKNLLWLEGEAKFKEELTGFVRPSLGRHLSEGGQRPNEKEKCTALGLEVTNSVLCTSAPSQDSRLLFCCHFDYFESLYKP